MTKRLTALGFAIVAVVWGPYVYAELARKPLPPAADESANTLIEPTPVAYQPHSQDRTQLLAALEAQEQLKAAARANLNAQPPAAEAVAPAEPEPAAEPTPEPATPPPAAETTAAPATEPAVAVPGQLSADHPSVVQQAQPLAANEPPQPPAAAEPQAPAVKPEAAPEDSAPPAKEPEAEHAEAKHAEKKEAEDPPAPESLAPAFRSAFDRESRDASWANGEEPKLSQLLATAGVPPSAIGEVRCQSTVCRVALNSVDLKAAEQSPLYQLLAQRVRDEFGTLGLDSAGGDGSAFYVLRKGAELSRDTN